MELRPALEGFAGIPQETRLLFTKLHSPKKVVVDGLLNTFHNTYRPRRQRQPGPVKIFEQARYVLSVTDRWNLGRFPRARALIRYGSLALTGASGVKNSIQKFDADVFRDFLWQSVFAKTLEANLFEDTIKRSYYMNSIGWDTMHVVGALTRLYPKFDTKQWDVVLVQTPFPGSVSDHTALVIRYHDAIPIYLPQHILNARLQMWAHFHALKQNAKSAWFVCTSAPVLSDLLRLFPEVESRSTVIPNLVSDAYFPDDSSNNEHIRQLVRSYTAQESKVNFRNVASEENFYRKRFSGDYIVAVGTIEPRKNYRLLITSWEKFNSLQTKKTQLVIVGEMGWNYENEHRQIKTWAKRGGIFHLARVPIWALRKIYSSALAVVCPSVSEGFDYSGIEAMQCATPVIASDISTHRAIYADAAHYFNPYSTSELVAQLQKVVDKKKCEQQMKRSQVVAAQYSAEAIVPQWHKFLTQVHAELRKQR